MREKILLRNCTIFFFRTHKESSINHIYQQIKNLKLLKNCRIFFFRTIRKILEIILSINQNFFVLCENIVIENIKSKIHINNKGPIIQYSRACVGTGLNSISGKWAIRATIIIIIINFE